MFQYSLGSTVKLVPRPKKILFPAFTQQEEPEHKLNQTTFKKSSFLHLRLLITLCYTPVICLLYILIIYLIKIWSSRDGEWIHFIKTLILWLICDQLMYWLWFMWDLSLLKLFQSTEKILCLFYLLFVFKDITNY